MSEMIVLSIEDDPLVRRSLCGLLESCGFTTTEAGDAASGLERFRTEAPDVVLCDLRLPDADGMTVVSAIAKESPETPVIVISGVDLVGDAVKALRLGAWDYLSKPIRSVDVLSRAVERAMERVRLLRENREHKRRLERLNHELTRAVRQFEDDASAGRKTQLQLLPPDRAHLGDCVASRRLFPSAYLSGDFVDYFAIDDHHSGFYITDVSGHGAASAFVTVIVKTLVGQYLRAHAREDDPTILHPERTLERLNRDLLAHQLDHHLTLFYGVIDRRNCTLTCSAGAQLPYPLLRSGGQVREIELPSRPIGLFPDARFEARGLELPESFELLLVSDGVLDLLPQQTLREKNTAIREALLGAGGSIDRIARALGLEEADDRPDDATLLLITKGADDA